MEEGSSVDLGSYRLIVVPVFSSFTTHISLGVERRFDPKVRPVFSI